MDKVLPAIEMPKIEPEEQQIIPDSGDVGDREMINELLDESNDNEENISHDIIDIDEREIPEEDEVFGDPPSVKPLKEPEFSELPEKKTGKRKYTRKNPMSQKQKDHLARIRKIAQEKKLKEKESKQKKKEEEVERKLEEKILKKKREEQQQHNEPTPPAQPQRTATTTGFTQQDLDKAVLNAVSTYDTYRKAQKKEKKERIQKDAEEQKMRDTIQRAIQPSAPTTDPWRSLFS
tara:strand:- start:11768 stop:12469 length:702 start_codon:yes stop_codon:yes gene_type:complete